MDNCFKNIVLGSKSREGMILGVYLLNEAVKVTMGPMGKFVIIEQPDDMPPIMTKDGATVVKFVKVKDKISNVGIQIVKEAALRTAEIAGDGTTASIIMSTALLREGLRVLKESYSSVDIINGIKIGYHSILEELKKNSMHVEINDEKVLKQVAIISVNGEKELGNLIAESLMKIGPEGSMSVEEAKGYRTTCEFVEGMSFESGYSSPYFVTDQKKMTAELDKPYILITDKKFSSIKSILPILEKVLNDNRSILIISDEVNGEALQSLVVNKLRGTLKVCATELPYKGEKRMDILQDLVSMFGGKIVTESSGDDLEDVNLKSLGECKKVIVSRDKTTMISKSKVSPDVEKRIYEIRKRLEEPTINENERKFLKERLAKLVGGIAILRIGGVSEIDVRERKDRADDAIGAIMSTWEEGVIPGGGSLLAKISNILDDLEFKNESEKIGINMLKEACLAPLRQIAENTGDSPDDVVNRVKQELKNVGYDAISRNYVDLMDFGIIDPTKVVRVSLENAVNVASFILSSGCVLLEEV